MPDESRRRVTGTAVPTRFKERIVVRRATENDLPQVAAMRLALLREEAKNPLFASPHPDAEARATRLTRAELAIPDEPFLVAVRSGEIVGMLRCRAVRRTPLVSESRQAVVTTVYVTPAQRRHGVLRSLLDAADRWCRRQGLTEMRLQCALTNEVGRKAWESLGFAPAELLYLREIPKT